MNITIRLETPEDYRPVEELTREAFWGFTRPDCDEHYLVHLLRPCPAFIPQLDFVAEVNGELAGNIMYSKATVTTDTGFVQEVITFGPLSILPKFQNTGIGGALLRHSVKRAAELGYKGIVFHGHPDYYPRYGFQNAAVFGITNAFGENYDALMAMELYDGALQDITGKFAEDPVFEITPEAAEAYDKNFPEKEKAKLISIEVLLKELSPPAQQAFRARQDIQALAWLTRYSGRELLAWEGMDEAALKIVNRILKEHGYAPKLLPGCQILEQAKKGIHVLV